MLDLDAINRRLSEMDDGEFVRRAPADIDTLVAEVERLRKAESYLTAWICDLRRDGGLQPCGHPRSAIIYNVCKEGEDISHYCGKCNAEAEEEQGG